MARRQTPIQKLVTFAMGVTEEELSSAMETLKAIKDSRFPKQAKAATTRKPRRTRIQTSTPPAPSATEPLSSES